jgi:hypothetical protein
MRDTCDALKRVLATHLSHILARLNTHLAAEATWRGIDGAQ